MKANLLIDGSSGEGGGQILRSALSLSLITGISFEIVNIRAGRKKPGLRPQHLTAVQAAAAICRGEVGGATIGSMRLHFRPGPVLPGAYRFDIGTAGSVALLLQTLVPPLALAKGPSEITVSGGTHVPFSPAFHYLALQWAPACRSVGIDVSLKLVRAGYYPKGGGRIVARIRAERPLKAVRFERRGAPLGVEGISLVGNLPRSIAERQKRRAEAMLREGGYHPEIRIVEPKSFGQGTMLLLLGRLEGGRGCYFSLGKRGKRAEVVAEEAAAKLIEFLEGDGAIDEHLADQLLLPLVLAEGDSVLRPHRITEHLRTNRDVILRFLDVSISDPGPPGGQAEVHVRGHGLLRQRMKSR
jgi:RNA 3'-terminal phosphate cyclase (ATP)